MDVVFPRRLGHQLFKGVVVAVRDQVARAFPALDVVGWIAPGGAGKFLIALEEFLING